MRRLIGVALFATAVIVAAAPAAAQVTSPGPTYYNQSGAPIPGAPYASPNPPSYNPPPQVTTGGPVYYNQPGTPPYDPAGPAYYNQSGAPIPGAPMRAMPAQTGGPLYAGAPQANNGQVWQNGRWVSLPAPGPGYGNANGNRWGQNINGRWWGGSQAPGGWSGYRRPRRGARLDPYWMRPDFQIPDYLTFGLAAPPYGTFWVRYYDDAVLLDAQGSVQASVSGIAWSSASASAGNGYASSAASASASAGGYQQGGPIGYVDPNPPYYGPQGGYAPPAPSYGPPAVQYGCPNTCPPQVIYQQGGGYQQGYQQQGYYQQGGYYGGGSTTTTVVIQSPPVVTTTIIEEEIVTEETVSTSYVRTAPRRTYRAPPRHRPKPRPVRRACGCRCVCR